MTLLGATLTLVLLGLVILLVSAPLRAASGRRREHSGADRRASADERPDGGEGSRRRGLEAEREAKYREIRDAELDYRTGKLSRSDYAAIDTALRAEAIEILDQIEDGEPSGGVDVDAESRDVPPGSGE